LIDFSISRDTNAVLKKLLKSIIFLIKIHYFTYKIRRILCKNMISTHKVRLLNLIVDRRLPHC